MGQEAKPCMVFWGAFICHTVHHVYARDWHFSENRSVRWIRGGLFVRMVGEIEDRNTNVFLHEARWLCVGFPCTGTRWVTVVLQYKVLGWISFSIPGWSLSLSLPLGRKDGPRSKMLLRYKTRMQNKYVQCGIEDERVHFFSCICVCMSCVYVCVTQPLPGISDGNTVRL